MSPPPRNSIRLLSVALSVSRTFLWMVPLVALFPACSLRVAGTVAKPTALELQLLGAYQELDDELVYASSIRGAAISERRSFDVIRAEAVEQRGLQQFNEDDLAELKNAGCIAESLATTVVERPCSLAKSDAVVGRRILRVVRQENRARESILTFAAHDLARSEGRVVPTRSELAEVRLTYQRLLRETASPGEVAEVSPGVFEEVRR